MLSPLLKKLLRDLWARKVSLGALTLVGVLGVAFLISSFGVYFDLRNARDSFYSSYNLADFRITIKAVPENLLRQLENEPGVEALEGTVALDARLDIPTFPDPVQATIVGVPARGKRFNKLKSSDGGQLKPLAYHQAFASSAFYRAHGLKVGDKIEAIMLGQQEYFQILGSVQSPEFVYVLAPGGSLAPDPLRTAVLFVPLRQLQEDGQLESSYNQILGRFSPNVRGNYQKERLVLNRLESRLNSYGVLEATPRSQFLSVQFLESDITGLKVSSSIMPTLCMLIVSVVLNVVMGRLIAGQRTIVGTLKALGYSDISINLHYLGFGLAVGLLSALGGLGLGFYLHSWLLALYRSIYELPIQEPGFYPQLIAIAVGIALVCSIVGTALGVRAATSLAPAIAMRPPPPEKGGKIMLERGFLQPLWRKLPFTFKLILRAIFRNPFRSSVTFGSSFIATTIMIESLAMGAAIGVLIDREFQQAKKQDLTVILREPQQLISCQRELQTLAGVGRVEGQLTVPASLISNVGQLSREREVLLVGLSEHPQLDNPLWLSPKIAEGFDADQKGLYLSKKLASVLGLRVGESVEVRLRRGTRRSLSLPIIGIVDTSLGLGCYTSSSQLSRLIGEAGVADKILLEAKPAARPKLVAELARRPEVLSITWRSDQLLQMQTTLQRNIGLMLNVIIVFCGFLAFGAVLNTALVALAEREREVGTLRVLGYSPLAVTAIFSGESLLLNVLGITCGWAGGAALTYGICRAYDTEIFRLPFVFNPGIVAIASATMLIFLATSQAALASIVRRLPWLDVLKIRE